MCAHVGVMFDWEGNKQQLLQGHVSFTHLYLISVPPSPGFGPTLYLFLSPLKIKKNAFTPEDFHKIWIFPLSIAEEYGSTLVECGSTTEEYG